MSFGSGGERYGDSLRLRRFGQVKAGSIGQEEPHHWAARPCNEAVRLGRFEPDEAASPLEIEGNGVAGGATRHDATPISAAVTTPPVMASGIGRSDFRELIPST